MQNIEVCDITNRAKILSKEQGVCMLLKEHLQDCTKDVLLESARDFELKNYSKLRKAELIDRLVECFCAEKMLRSRVACLTDEQIAIFRKACTVPQDIAQDEIIDSLQLCQYWMGYFTESTDQFCVFEDVADTFSRIDDQDFKEEQNKKGWMTKCLEFSSFFYGIVSLEVLHKLYQLKIQSTLDEMIEMLQEMPMEMIEAGIFSMENLGMENWSKEEPLYSEKGILVHFQFLEEEEFDELLKHQMGKPFYIPTVEQIEEICKHGYEESSLTYRKLKQFFITKMNMSEDMASVWCLRAWANCFEGESPTNVVNMMYEENIVLEDEKQANEFIAILMTAHNDTRLKENRGFKPDELAGKKALPVSPKEPVKAQKKIYPNEPCPCGSGKKYKKCCGRNI